MKKLKFWKYLMGGVIFWSLIPGLSAYELLGTQWGPQGTTVTYSFDYRLGGYSYTDYGTPAFSGTTDVFDPAWEPIIVQAFQTWSAVCGLNFVRVADSGQAFDTNGAQGNIRIAMHAMDGAFGVLAHAYGPTDPFPAPEFNGGGDLHFDSAEDWFWGPGTPGGTQIDLLTVAIHEIGHSIGLGHSADATAVMGEFYTGVKTTLTADDIAGAQIMYSTATPEPAALLLVMLCFGAYCFLPAGQDSLKNRDTRVTKTNSPRRG